jgi:peptidyl-dipeptidase Dcp
MTLINTTPALAATAPAESALLAPWTGAYGGVPPFDQVRVENFRPALEAGMKEQLAEVEWIS